MRKGCCLRIVGSLFLCLLAGGRAAAGDVPYGVGDWPDSLGNHRVRVQVAAKADAVWAHLPWRRRDATPEKKEIIVIDAATNKRVENVLRVRVERESGDLLFRPPTAPGEYYVYYLPYRYIGCYWWPTTIYTLPTDTANPAWTKACQPLIQRVAAGDAQGIPAAKVLEFQSINDFHRFDPMEVPATADEMRKLQTAHSGKPYLLFPEDRRFPIRMTDELPLRWIRSGPSNSFCGEACRGEYYVFQVGLYTMGRNLDNVRVRFTPLRSDKRSIPVEAMTCFNTGGTDYLGHPFVKPLGVAKGRVQPLWIGVQVPKDATPGVYRGAVAIAASGVPESAVQIALTVNDKVLEDAGDSDLWRHSRLRWLNSRIAIDDDVFGPYTPVTVDDQTIKVLGRRAHFVQTGLFDSLQSTFGYSVDNIDSPPQEILAGAMKFVVDAADGPVAWTGENPRIVARSNGAVAWETTRRTDGLTLQCWAQMQCDGWINYRLTIRALRPVQLTNAHLEIPLRREAAKYMMGMGHKGGPRSTPWKWDPNVCIPHVWIGDVNAGLFYKGWGYQGQPPQDGGATVTEEGDAVIVRQTTGPRSLAAGQEWLLQFGLMVTPTKMLDKRHWQWRYYHAEVPAAQAAAAGATIINIHHGGSANPHINYPFLAIDQLTARVKDAHAHGLKLKIYYTLRELSSYVAEFWAVRSLGNEIFYSGPGFQTVAAPKDAKPAGPVLVNNDTNKPGVKSPWGLLPATGSSWLAEHAITDYSPAWHQPLGNGRYDAAINLLGQTRWENYYLEGLAWLVKNVGIDGLYLDDLAYDHETMKRVRKILDRTRPGCLIDLHSNNWQGIYKKSPATFYIEHMPMVDSLWFGEVFDYDHESPDYWLVEISGIPYGLFGEMLEGGGNPWRGMIYGMTSRIYSGDPRPIWKVWDEFGIQDARMIGYWDPACPVHTDNKDVPATAYVKPGKVLVSVASWAPQTVKCRLKIDWKAIGLDPAKAKISARKIENFQPAAEFGPNDEIPVQPKRGWLLVLHE